MKTYDQQSSGLQFRYICGACIMNLVLIASAGVAAYLKVVAFGGAHTTSTPYNLVLNR
jgi:hypothetical protein